MAQAKAEKPVGTQLFGPSKKEPAVAKAPKTSASTKPAAKKAAPKATTTTTTTTQAPKRKAKGGKAGA